MTNDNTRTKANAVFFSVLMVISMVAVGFAAAPAAAANDDSTITFEDQQIDDGTVSVDTDIAGSPGDVVLTETDSDLTVVDVVEGVETGEQTTSLSVESGGEYQAHVFDDASLSAGDSADSASTGPVVSSDSAQVQPESRSPGTLTAYNNTQVFQGEEDISFVDSDGSGVDVGDLEGTSGNREGTPLQMPIPENEETGTYSTAGANYNGNSFAVSVVEPRINTAEVQLNENDVSQISSSRAVTDGSRNFEVYAEWNFANAENLSVEVQDPSGADITDEVMEDGSTLVADDGSARLDIDLSTEDSGEYTVIFEGAESIDQDSVIEEYTIETTSQDSISLETAEDSVTRGDNLDYTVSGGTNADYHTVTIDASDFRDDLSVEDAQDIFRNVQDVSETGAYDLSADDTVEGASTEDIDDVDYAYALVEVDGTTAAGSIETAYLDDASIDVDVYEGKTEADAIRNTSGYDSVDDVSFDVNEGDVSLNSPTGSYTVGSEVDINGSATSADTVAIFARDNDNWEPLNLDEEQYGDEVTTDDLTTISVDSDDTFEEEDVRLSGANNIFSFEGSYDIGVVDVADLDGSSNGNFADGELSTSEFATASSARYTLDVQAGDLTANFGTINGQIATVDNQIDVNGTAAGQDNVVVAFVGQRGDVETRTVSVDSDDTFDRDDISLDSISQGSVSAHVISPGRDSQFGDGGDGYADASALAETISGFGGGQSSGDQIRSSIVANTIDETGSDDLMVSTTFRLNDATLGINNVYPEDAQAQGVNPVAVGETMVVEGDTNRQPDNAAVTFEILNQEEESVTSASTDEWGSDGQFSNTFDTSDLETGTYILEIDDGESTDRVNVEIVEERQQPDDGDDGDDSSGDDSSGDDSSGDDSSGDDSSGDDSSGDDSSGDDSSGDDSSGDDSSGDDSSGDDSTDDGTPGFGALVALVALIAAALLATRRNN
ncbi:HVO_2072 family ArtA-dependent S-layer glycoprotein [Halorubrum xinjiangense]|uniref:HVO_2072 family ArtA-dependent S-layer glycoprotein n=1 Tax=Halorubrum xinjiangense TaxID=261291 RepID=UPI003C6EE303